MPCVQENSSLASGGRRIYWVVTNIISKRSRLANAAKHPDDDQPGALVCLIALINVYNRLNGITHQPTGDYTPG